MAPKTNLKEEKAPEKFHKSIADYYAARDNFNAAKLRLLDGHPSEPARTLPKIPKQKAWWDTEMEREWDELFPEVYSDDDQESDSMAKLDLQDTTAEQKQERRRARQYAKFREAMYAAPFAMGQAKGDSIGEIDARKFVAKITGQEGLIVPGGLSCPK